MRQDHPAFIHQKAHIMLTKLSAIITSSVLAACCLTPQPITPHYDPYMCTNRTTCSQQDSTSVDAMMFDEHGHISFIHKNFRDPRG